jgi:hypothetical protein
MVQVVQHLSAMEEAVSSKPSTVQATAAHVCNPSYSGGKDQ